MKQYIDKSALVAEIEKLKLCTMDKHMNFYSEAAEGEYHALSNIESFLNTLEVKEVEEEPSIWHDANKQPTMYRKYLVRYSDGRVSGSWERHDNGFIPWKDVIKEHGFTHWCYVEDLIKL